MDLYAIGALYQDGGLRTRIQGACLLHRVELTEDVVCAVITNEDTLAALQGVGEVTGDSIPNSVIETVVGGLDQ